MSQLQGQHFLKILDLNAADVTRLLDLADALKAAKARGEEERRLQGRNIALIFEKGSTRTRCAFEVAASDQGAGTTYLGPTGTHIGSKESVADTARVLGRMYDAIAYRGFGQSVVDELAKHAGVPVYNALTDEWHPTQMLADLMTMREHSGGSLEGVRFAYVGDARCNMGHSLMAAGALMGLDVRIGAPRELWPSAAFREAAEAAAKQSGATLTLTEDPGEAVRGVDYVHTDVWVSMGEDASVWGERIALLSPYRVDAALMAKAAPDARFMHCLPAFHNTDTTMGRELESEFGITEMEVSDAVFESAASIVFDQAENRMHTIKAIMVATLGR